MDKPKWTSAKKQYFKFPHKAYASLRRLQPEIQLKHSRSNVIKHAFLYLQWLKIGVDILGSQLCPEDKNYTELKQLFKTRWGNNSSCKRHHHRQQQEQHQPRRSQMQHINVGSREGDGSGSRHSAGHSTAVATTSLDSRKQQTLKSEKKKAYGNGIDEIDRKYNQRKCLKKFCGCMKGPHAVKDTRKEHKYHTDAAASVDNGHSWKPQDVDHNLKNVDDFTPSEALESPDDFSEMKTMEVLGRDSFRLDFISSSPRFKKLHDLYVENTNYSQDRLALKSHTVAAGSSEKNRSSPRHRYGGVDPMWAQYMPPSCSSPQSLASTSNLCSSLLRSPSHSRDCSDLTSPFHKRKRFCDQENSPLRAVLEMNLFGSPTSKNVSLSSGTLYKRVCNISQDENCKIGYPSVAPLSPWNTKKFVPYSPSVFSVRAALLGGRTSADETSESIFLSRGIKLISRYPPHRNRRVRPPVKTPTKANRAGEARHNRSL